MSSKQELYFKLLNESLINTQDSDIVNNNLSNYQNSTREAVAQFKNIELAKKRAANIRQKTIDYLDTHLINFESELVKRNIRVVWASDAEEANKVIFEIIKNKEAKTVVKSKSTTLNEIGLTELLNDFKINVIETDTGDYVNQLANQKPFHNIFPLLNKSFEDVNKILNKNFSDLHQAAAFIADEISEKLVGAPIFISGATFLLADVGGIVFTENEGNILKSLANSQTHIVVCGIDKMLASINDLDLFLPLLSSHATGQFNANYHTVITNTISNAVTGKPIELIVVLLDNGRSELLLNPDVRRAMGCIKCGSCLLNDPLVVFNTKAQQGYYKGIIGSIINQHYDDETQYAYQAFINPSNAALNSKCPVALDFNKLLLINRRDNVNKRLVPRADSIAMFFYKGSVLKRSNMEKGGSKLKNFMLRQFFKKSWGQNREFPIVANQSFNELWKQKNN